MDAGDPRMIEARFKLNYHAKMLESVEQFGGEEAVKNDPDSKSEIPDKPPVTPDPSPYRSTGTPDPNGHKSTGTRGSFEYDGRTYAGAFQYAEAIFADIAYLMQDLLKTKVDELKKMIEYGRRRAFHDE